MIVSVGWLRALVPGLEDSAQTIADEISQRAVPVESVETIGHGLEDVVIGRVESKTKHPNADRLTLCRVDEGSGTLVDVVCGAPEIVEGGLYPFITPGGTLPGGFRIERRDIRGQESHGMLCSEKELSLGPESSGIMLLSGELRVGQKLTEVLGLPDARLDLDLTPNRVDLAGHLGVARELAAARGLRVVCPAVGDGDWTPVWQDGETEAAAAGVRVRIEDPERCSRYLAAVVRGVRVEPSPEWLAARIRAVGARPINNVVDATNYVLLELNQPLHAFDLALLAGPEIRVRRSADESIETLDGTERELDGSVTVIADRDRPIALAGVMGGADSQVTAGTTDVLIECAAFDPGHTRSTARNTGLSTDASYRFERGIDETGLEAALVRCVRLLLSVAGGDAEAEALRVGPRPDSARVIVLRPARVRQVLGLRLSAAQIAGLLEPLGFTCEVEDSNEDSSVRAEIRVTVPGWRRDVELEVDLLEEVARAYGYDSFPQEPRRVRPGSVPDAPMWRRRDRVSSWLAARGLYEARSVSFVPEALTTGEPARPLLPLSREEDCLRTDLLPGLVSRLEHNYSRGHRDVRLFEVGAVFRRRGGEEPFEEHHRVAVLWTGGRQPSHWSEPAKDFDLWALKGLATQLVASLGLGLLEPAENQRAEPSGGDLGVHAWLDPGSYRIVKEGREVGCAGTLSPARVDAPPWAAPAFALEFRLDAVALDEPILYRKLPAYPAVARDLALILPEKIPAGEVEVVMRGAAPDHLETLRLFDVFSGDGIEEGYRSLAWRMVFRDAGRTLTDKEVDASLSLIRNALQGNFDVRFRDS